VAFVCSWVVMLVITFDVVYSYMTLPVSVTIMLQTFLQGLKIVGQVQL